MGQFRTGLSIDHGMLLDAKYRMIDSPEGRFPEILLYYRDYENERAISVVSDFRPYFYINTDRQSLLQLTRNYSDLDDWIIDIEEVTKRTYNKGRSVNLLKITGTVPWDVPKFRTIFSSRGIDVFEADIPFIHRFMIDRDIYGLQHFQLSKMRGSSAGALQASKLKVMSFDIEIDIEFDQDQPSDSLSLILEEASKRITVISCYWGVDRNIGEGKVFIVDSDNDEAETQMIEDFWTYVWQTIDPDVLVSYNGDNFDFPYMVKRMELLGLSSTLLSPHQDSPPSEPGYGRGWTIPGLLVYDLFKRTKWLYTDDGRKSLQSVAKTILGEGKMDLSLSHGQMWRQGLQNEAVMETLKEYALTDAKLTYQLYFGMGVSEWLEVIKITGSPPREAMYYTQRQAGEFLLYRVMNETGTLIPPSPGPEGKKERDKTRVSAEGGLVLEPKVSIATGVMIADFSSMYPTLMISHNIGAESFRGTGHDYKNRFNSTPKTTMAIMQERLLERRLEVKDRLKESDLDGEDKEQLGKYSWALKIVLNSTIGSYNYTGSRLYDTEISGSVTGLGRTYLLQLAQQAKEFHSDHETLYGDTDSVFIQLIQEDKTEDLWKISNPTPEQIRDKLPNMFNLLEYLQDNLPDEMRLELQDIAFRILFHKGAKKRYSFVSAISKDIVITGFEAVRHDWSPFARNIQKKAIELVLTSGNLEYSKVELIAAIKKYLALPQEDLTKELIKLGPIKRAPDKYKSMTPAVSSFMHYCNKKGLDVDVEWKHYDYFPYLVIEGTEPMYQRSRHPEYIEEGHIDIAYYLQEAINAVNRFNLNLSLEEIMYTSGDITSYFEE